jgi:hypothetical protein
MTAPFNARYVWDDRRFGPAAAALCNANNPKGKKIAPTATVASVISGAET